MEHISEAILYHAEIAITVTKTKARFERNKKGILGQMKTNFDLVSKRLKELDESYFEIKVKFWNGPTTRRKVLNFAMDHITHHRGQAIVYLRMMNIPPPNYISW